MRCRTARRLLVAFQDEELSPGETTRVAEHLETCASCRDEEASLRAVTPASLHLVHSTEEPDWSQMDQALTQSWVPPAPNRPFFLPKKRLMLGLYGLALGLLMAWGVRSAARIQHLEAELAIATSAPAVETLFPATAMHPASFKPHETDGKPH